MEKNTETSLKIYSATLSTETNTFSPMPTGKDDWDAYRPSDIEEEDGDEQGTVPFWSKLSKEQGYEFTWGLIAGAQPSGRTVQAVYEGFRDEILDALKATEPVDIVLLDLHGAMVAMAQDDCEGDLIDRVREITGPDTVIGVLLDPHCNLTRLMVDKSDLIILYKEYPHVDVLDRARELFQLAVKTKLGKIQPTMSVFDCRMVKVFPTTVEPMRGFVDSMIEREKQDGVLSLSLAHGFPWGDMAESGTRMLAMTDKDAALAENMAAEFGGKIVNMRHEKLLDFMSVDQALSKAAASEKSPVVVADIADNAGGGAPSDSTFALEWLLAHDVTNAAIAFIWDPIVVQIAKAAGEGATLDVRLGGKMGPPSGRPLDLSVTVTGVKDDFEYDVNFSQNDEVAMTVPAGDSVALNCRGIDIIVCSKRGQCFSPTAFTGFGIDPAKKKILIPKSTQHFYAAFSPIAEEVLYMDSPGALNADLASLPYKVMDKKKYPWMDDPFSTT